MAGIYVRTISIYRPTPAQSGGALQVGNVGYAALQPADEALVFSGIPASIQAEAMGNARAVDVPSGSPGPIKWSIFVPKSALQLGDVVEADIVVDDIGGRYQVAAPYYNLLGYKLLTIRLEA